MKTEESNESAPADSLSKHSGGARWLMRLAGVFLLVVAVAVGLLAGSFLRFSRDVIELTPPKSLAKADGIVVLTGGSRRIDRAIELLDNGTAAHLLISGVNPSTTGSQIQRLTKAEPALFECCVDIGHDAIDTIGNANEAALWVRKHGYRNVIVVTSNYHMPRSLLELRRVDPQTNFVPYPVVTLELTHLRWLQEPGALRMLAAEYVKYLGARLHLSRGTHSRDGLRSSNGGIATGQAAASGQLKGD
ncbi:YdcF family protein [Hoeflea prorocentri]|uniref:YdcF family protein n=1 Tax=Hoeflea prorocentri TaxID=1922333 RepID=A0A9X3UML5_9HYPH|nr:YdcF family protein [Hoeflea prorocentri]MCY6383635.1 YdcF family protein [Hoeflea prorocentri]MDA5401435.1 YdcF family protein [Hoeflea prorocentri]